MDISKTYLLTKNLLIVYFLCLLLNVNGILGFYTGNFGILTSFLTSIGFLSLVLVRKNFKLVLDQLIIRRVFLLMLFYVFFGSLVTYLSSYQENNQFISQIALNSLLKTILIIFPIASLFIYLKRYFSLTTLVFKLFFLMLFTSLSVPVFKFLGISFELLSLNIDVYKRYSGIWGNANVASSFINFTLIILYYLRIENKVNRLGFNLFFIFLIYSAFLTLSTTGFIITIVNYIIFRFYIAKNSKYFFPALIGFIILFLLIFSFISNILLPNILDNNDFEFSKVSNFISILNFDLYNLNSSGRLEMINLSINEILQNWITGLGYGYYSAVDAFNGQGMHNYFLLIFGEVGFVGLILLLSFLYAFLHLYLRMRTQAEKFILLSSLVFFILVFISGAGIIGNSNMLIFCLIISAISSPIGQRM